VIDVEQNIDTVTLAKAMGRAKSMKTRIATAFTLLFAAWFSTNVQARCPENPEDCNVPPGTAGDFSGLPIDLLPPGARALGLGGAFTAVADDSTAALANPAGLTNLSAPEVSVYIRNTDADFNFFDPDAFNSGFDSWAGHIDKTFSDSSTDVSFASFVIPAEGFVFSGFYSNQLEFDAMQSMEDIVFDDIARPDPERGERAYFDQYVNVNSVTSSVENVGLSAAFRLTDRFSAGLTVRNSKLKLKSQDSWELGWWYEWEYTMADFFFGLPEDRLATIDEASQFLPVVNDFLTYSTTVDGSEQDLELDLGRYYKGDKWSFGLVYHAGSKFNFGTTGTVVSDFSCNNTDQAMFDECQFWVDLVDELGLTETLYPNVTTTDEVVIKLPDVFSFGVAWRPASTWLLSFDVNHIEYSVLNEPRRITLGFGIDVNDEVLRQRFADPTIRDIQGPVIEPIDDETTYHFGVEKSFFFDTGVLRTLALRGGAFTIKDHDGVVATDNDETVWTLGLGSTWGKNELGAKVFQVDLGASFADDVTNIVLSGIFRF
jgi:long-subunit fatty acid transport protein